METAKNIASGLSIHMNGRVYDYNLGRFLSVDPFIQGIDSQAINPYSYIQNNPLSGTDPSGYAAASEHHCKVALHSSCDGTKGDDPNGNENNENTNTTNGQTNQQQGANTANNSDSPTIGEFLEFAADNFSELWSNATELTNEQYFGDSVAGEAFIGATDPVSAAIDAVKDVQNGSVAGAVAGVIANKIPGGKAVKDVVGNKIDDVVNRARKPGSAGVDRTGKDFTPKTKRELDADNAARNGGVNKCENCSVETAAGQRSQHGVTPPGNERQRDHIIPKSKGGDGTFENGQILCRTCNLKKRDN